MRYQSGQMDQTVNLTAQAFEGSNPSLTTNRPYKSRDEGRMLGSETTLTTNRTYESCNSIEDKALHDPYVSNELYDVEVLDLKKLRRGIVESVLV